MVNTHTCLSCFHPDRWRARHREWRAIALFILSREEVMNHTLLFVVVVSIQVQIGSRSLSLSLFHTYMSTRTLEITEEVNRPETSTLVVYSDILILSVRSLCHG